MRVVFIGLIIIGFLMMWGTEGTTNREFYLAAHDVPFVPTPVRTVIAHSIVGLVVFAGGVFGLKRMRKQDTK